MTLGGLSNRSHLNVYLVSVFHIFFLETDFFFEMGETDLESKHYLIA